MKVDLFNKVLKIPTHILHSLLPPPVSHTQRYGLRPRVHDRTLQERSSNLVDCNFIIRMLYMNAYWLNNGLFYVTSMLCFTLLYVVALCFKMRYLILCIKRLLIDWLIGNQCYKSAINHCSHGQLNWQMRITLQLIMLSSHLYQVKPTTRCNDPCAVAKIYKPRVWDKVPVGCTLVISWYPNFLTMQWRKSQQIICKIMVAFRKQLAKTW